MSLNENMEFEPVEEIAEETVEETVEEPVDNREDFRKISYIRAACVKTVSGHGFDGYIEAIDYLAGEYVK